MGRGKFGSDDIGLDQRRRCRLKSQCEPIALLGHSDAVARHWQIAEAELDDAPDRQPGRGADRTAMTLEDWRRNSIGRRLAQP